MFKLAELFVDIRARDDGLRKQLESAKGEVSGWRRSMETAVGNLASGAISNAAAAVTGFFASGIKGAVDLQETLSKVNTIFGEGASAIIGQADEMASRFGVARGEFLNAASDFGSAFKAVGRSQADAAALGNQLAKLGMDMASFNNASNEEAFTALRAALRGEFDPLERFNVMLSAAAIEQEALSLGLVKSAKDMDEAAKKQATLSLVMKKTVDQQGDLERTADGTANSWRKLTGTLDNLATEMGTALEPAINALVAAGNAMVAELRPAFDALKAGFAGFSSFVIDAVATIGAAWRGLSDTWQIVQLKAQEMGTNLLAIVATIPENLGIIGAWIANNWTNLIADGLTAVESIFGNAVTNLTSLWSAFLNYLSTGEFNFDWKPLLDGFKATTASLPGLAKPDLVSLQSEIDAVGDRIARRESRRAEEIASQQRAKQAPAKAAAAAAGKKAEEFKAESFSGEDYYAKLRAAGLKGGDDTPKRQLEEQTKTRVAAEKTAQLLGGGALVATLG